MCVNVSQYRSVCVSILVCLSSVTYASFKRRSKRIKRVGGVEGVPHGWCGGVCLVCVFSFFYFVFLFVFLFV